MTEFLIFLNGFLRPLKLFCKDQNEEILQLFQYAITSGSENAPLVLLPNRWGKFQCDPVWSLENSQGWPTIIVWKLFQNGTKCQPFKGHVFNLDIRTGCKTTIHRPIQSYCILDTNNQFGLTQISLSAN